MGNVTNDEHWAARERLRRVEFLLWWRGWVGRPDLTELYGISAAQASGDLQKYAELNVGAMVYHTSRKRYEAAERMVCVLHEPSFAEAVRVFCGGPGFSGGMVMGEASAEGVVAMDAVVLPKRGADMRIERALMVALTGRLKLQVRYVALSSGSDEWRELCPRALVWDGQRWHVRAWCGLREEWRDFVPGRMKACKWPSEAAGELPRDEDWEVHETVKLQINPKLTASQQATVRQDYGLNGDVLEARVRKAVVSYWLAAMFIDSSSHRALPRHFVVDK